MVCQTTTPRLLFYLMCFSPNKLPSYIRIIDDNPAWKFIKLLSYENWECVFQDIDVNLIFNTLLSTYLTVFNSSFPLKKKTKTTKPKAWLTTVIKISCANKRMCGNFDHVGVTKFMWGFSALLL